MSTTDRGMVGTMGLVVFAVFLIQKLTGAISWSWWWVTTPLWIVVLAVIVPNSDDK